MQATLDTPLGRILLREEEGMLTGLTFAASTESLPPESPLLMEASRQLEDYFAGTRRSFSLPLAPGGTAFQKRVWAALLQIPYGETATYAGIAEKIGSKRACRAVGSAVGKNPLLILIPCHRVVAAGGRMGGYAGGRTLKAQLLALEMHEHANK